MAAGAPMSQKDLDQLYLYAAHSVRGVKPLLRSFFGFLQRNTDFYEASPEACQHMVLSVLQEFGPSQDHTKQDKFVKIPRTQSATIEEIDQQLDDPKSTDHKKSSVESQDEEEEEEDVGFEPSKRTKKGSVYPNEGDGSTFRDYKWIQAPKELEILIPLCKHRRDQKSKLDVAFTPSSIRVSLGSDEIWGGELADKIKTDEVTWTIEDNILCIRAEKVKLAWWRQLLISEPRLLLQHILRRHNTLDEISSVEIQSMKKAVVNKGKHAEEMHQKQFPDKIPLPEHLRDQPSAP